MELIDYLRMLRRQWLWVVGSVVVLTALAAAYVSVAPKSYRATSDIYVLGTVVQPVQNQNDAAQSASKYVFDNIDSFAALVDSPKVTGPVIKELKLADKSPEQLAKQVTATVVPNTVIITVAATDPSPGQAAAIANATAGSLTDAIKSLAIPGSETPLQISSVKPATPPTSPDSPNRTLWLALGVLLGLALGLVIATLREQSRRAPKAAAAVDEPTMTEPTVAESTVDGSGAPATGAAGTSRPAADDAVRVPAAQPRKVDLGKPVDSNGTHTSSGSNGAASTTPTDPETAPRDPAPTRR